MKNQLQMFYSEQRKIASLNEFFAWLSIQENAPTKNEIEKLKVKNPKVWNKYPQSLAK